MNTQKTPPSVETLKFVVVCPCAQITLLNETMRSQPILGGPVGSTFATGLLQDLGNPDSPYDGSNP
jgi:hypothetical protein